MPTPRNEVLPANLAPIGLKREQAAAYIGFSPAKFDQLVKNRLMPLPKRVGYSVRWDLEKVKKAFKALPEDGNHSDNEWDD